MSAAESTKTLAGKPWPNGDPATWVYIADLPTTPEVEQAVDEKCRRYGFSSRFWRWWHRRLVRDFREAAKCVHYFENKCIVYRNTKRGKLVLLVGEENAPEIWEFKTNLPAELRGQTISWHVYTGPYSDWYHIWGEQDEA